MLLLSTSYFPPAEYYQQLLLANSCVLDVYEYYEKQTWRNRCAVLGANGVQMMVVPVKKVHGEKVITKEVRIAYDDDWQKNHLRTLMSAYKNAPFYDYIIDDFLPLISTKEKYLLDLNLKIHQVICSYLAVPDVLPTSTQYLSAPTDEGWVDSRFSKDKQEPIQSPSLVAYRQVFQDKHGFVPHLSILDVLFNLGSNAYDYLSGNFE